MSVPTERVITRTDGVTPGITSDDSSLEFADETKADGGVLLKKEDYSKGLKSQGLVEGKERNQILPLKSPTS